MSMIMNGNNLAAYTANEVLTSLKRKFSVHEQVTLAANETRYIGVTLPISADGVITAFNERVIRPINGDLEIAVCRDVTFDDSALTAWKAIPGYQGADEEKTKFYDLTTNVPTTTPGNLETDFEERDTLLATGTGSNQVGGSFPDTGFRVYQQNKQACLRLKNPSGSDDVTVTVIYSWVEVRAN